MLDPAGARGKLKLLRRACGKQYGLIRISQGVHAAMRVFICEVDETGLRRLLPEDVFAGDRVRGYTRHRFAGPTTVAWALLEDGVAETIRSAVSAGHHDTACVLLLNRAIELLSLAAALPETTLPA